MPAVEFIQVEPTTRCNFKCAFCPRRHLEQGDMNYDLFSKILREYPDIRYLQLYGEGEPLMYPLFFSMVKEAVNKNIKISTITNGSLLERDLENVLASGLNSVHVSLESPDPNTFHKIRGGNLTDILKGIKLLIETRNKVNSATPFVGFSVTVLKETKDDLNHIFEHYQKLDMDGGIIIQPLNEMTSYTNNYNDEVNYQALTNADLENIDQELENNKILKKIRKDRRLDLTYFEALRHNFNPEQDGCPWLLRSLFVNFLGYAMPCSMIKNIALYSFGHVGSDSVKSIMEKREKMRARILSGDIPEACNNCRTLDYRYKPGKMYQYLDHKNELPRNKLRGTKR
jgi:MoaA/NifB/PqqE/SkfB family radical SAM enzyme